MTSIFITPGISGKKPVIEQPGVETFQRFFPQDPGKFCTLFSKALSSTKVAVIRSEIAQPTTRQACTTAKYKQPSSVQI
jgi:hypothetical protein